MQITQAQIEFAALNNIWLVLENIQNCPTSIVG